MQRHLASSAFKHAMITMANVAVYNKTRLHVLDLNAEKIPGVGCAGLRAARKADGNALQVADLQAANIQGERVDLARAEGLPAPVQQWHFAGGAASACIRERTSDISNGQDTGRHSH